MRQCSAVVLVAPIQVVKLLMSAALSQYEACCKALKEELGTLPEEPTRLLAKRIQKGELQKKPQYKQTSPPVPAYYP